MGVAPHGDSEGPGEAEVSELKLTFAVYQEVRGFEVAVEDAVVVAVGDAGEELKEEGFKDGHAETAVAYVQVFLEVLVEELEDEGELCVCV